MKYCSFILATSLLAACGQPFQVLFIDDELISYVEEFETDCNCNVTIPIAFQSLSLMSKVVTDEYEDHYAGFVGLCRKYSNGRREIFIDPEYWFSSNYGHRITLIYHELGHCVLDQGHRSDSIMFDYNFDATSNWDWYVNELFGRL